MTAVYRSRTARKYGARSALLSLPVSAVLVAGTLVGTGVAAADPLPGAGALAGRTVFLDPGHQGSAAGHRLNQQVPDGRGGMKDCQTTGTTALGGKKEHTINWDVAQLVKAALESEGARVVLSRNDDTGWGGCVDERAAAASASGADLAVSLHADSTSTKEDPAKSGFHMIIPTLPLPDAQAQAAQSGGGRKASAAMRDAFQKAGFKPSNYTGKNGLQTRSDIAGVNLTKVPIVFIEMGNLANPGEAKELSSPQGSTRYALAVTNGIKDYLAGVPAASTDEAAPGANPADDLGDLVGLEAVGPLIEKLAKAKSPEDAMKILSAEGPDTSAEVLKAMLAVVYAVFGGKLPV